MDVKSTSRTIVETTHAVTMDKADQGALFAVAARNKLGAAADAPAGVTKNDDGSITVTIVMTSEGAAETPAAAQTSAGPAIPTSIAPIV